MSFYTIDGRFLNKKRIIEGFDDNSVIITSPLNGSNLISDSLNIVPISLNLSESLDSASIRFEDNGTNSSADTNSPHVINLPDDNLVARGPTQGPIQVTIPNGLVYGNKYNVIFSGTKGIEIVTKTINNVEFMSSIEDPPVPPPPTDGGPLGGQPVPPTEELPTEDQPTEDQPTEELPESDDKLQMHFCINNKCITGNELRKLNELYDKKCNQ